MMLASIQDGLPTDSYKLYSSMYHTGASKFTSIHSANHYPHLPLNQFLKPLDSICFNQVADLLLTGFLNSLKTDNY